MSEYKGKLKQRTGTTTADVMHPETTADQVLYQKTIENTEVANVSEALDAIAAGIGVTGIKGNAETNYRKGNVNITPANVGAVAANQAITGGTKTKITFDSKGLVTGGTNLSESDIPDIHLAKISDAGTAAAKGVATTISSSSTDNDLATAKAVFTAIDNLPEPMVFKGTLGTNGTITSLPTVAKSNEGHTYKVITAGTYASQSAKVGDVFTSTGTAWVLIPAGDDIEDTWRSIKVNGTELLGSGISTGALNLKNGGHITVTGSGNDATFGVESGYSIPSDSSQNSWNGKIDKSTVLAKGDMIYASGNAAPTRIGIGTDGQVLSVDGENGVPEWKTLSIGVTNPSVSTSGSGNAVTGVSISNGQIAVKKGTTFLTEHQDISGKVDKLVNKPTPGTYSALTINSEGQVTVGMQVFEVIENGATPSVPTGGLFFEKDP